MVSDILERDNKSSNSDNSNDRNILEDALWAMGESACELHGFSLLEVELNKGKGRWLVRFYIDSENGVDVDDCAMVSRTIGRFMDARDPIDYPYTLEVSSPGLDRPLRRAEDFAKYSGDHIKIKTKEPVSGRKSFTGTLQGISDGIVIIETIDGEKFDISLSNIKKARLKQDHL